LTCARLSATSLLGIGLGAAAAAGNSSGSAGFRFSSHVIAALTQKLTALATCPCSLSIVL
jgi:hypothetical protein